MSHRVDAEGVVYDLDSPNRERIGVVDKERSGIVLDEDVDRDDGRYDEPDWRGDAIAVCQHACPRDHRLSQRSAERAAR